MPRQGNPVVSVICFLLCVAGCSDLPCPQLGMPASPAIQVTVWDAVSDEPLNSGVTGLAVLSGRSYPLESMGGNVLSTYGGAGTYDLFVAKDGYLPWYTCGVKVTGSRCTTHTTSIRVEMIRFETTAPNPHEPPSRQGKSLSSPLAALNHGDW
jgi:hypothetical protein